MNNKKSKNILVEDTINVRHNSKKYIHLSAATPATYSKNLNNYTKKDLLALIVGFIDGDGYIRVTKKTKKSAQGAINYIYISLVINLHYNEFELLKYFSEQLNIGKVYMITPKTGNKVVRLEINKTDFKNILIPLLENNNIKFLTINRQNQYLLAKYILENNIIYYEDLTKYQIEIDKYINENFINNSFHKLDYFNN
jgi:hypothetical protein